MTKTQKCRCCAEPDGWVNGDVLEGVMTAWVAPRACLNSSDRMRTTPILQSL